MIIWSWIMAVLIYGLIALSAACCLFVAMIGNARPPHDDEIDVSAVEEIERRQRHGGQP